MSGAIYYEVSYYTDLEAFLDHRAIYREFFKCPKSYAITLADVRIKKSHYFTYEITERTY